MDIAKKEKSEMEDEKINPGIDLDSGEKKEENCEEEEEPTVHTEIDRCETENGKKEENGDSERGEQTEKETDEEEGKVIAQREGEHTVDVKADEVIEVNTEEREDETDSCPTYDNDISKGDDEKGEDVKTVDKDKLKDSSTAENEDAEVTSNGFEVIAEDSLNIPFTHYVDHKNLTETSRGSNETEGLDGENELIQLLRVYKQSNKDLKDFHRRNSWGTHHTIRGQLWVRVCETLHKAKGNLYDDYEKDLFHQSKFRTFNSYVRLEFGGIQVPFLLEFLALL